MTWNVNSWTQNNKTLRENIIVNMSCDIVCLNETHLSGNDIIDVSGYTWFGFNRQTRHVKATKTSGGVGILVEDSCFENFHVRIIDRNFAGVLRMGLQHKFTNHTIVIYSFYLPPENSVWSNPTEVYAHLISQIYLRTYADAIYLCGDLNARTGNLCDYIPEVEDIPPRKLVDTTRYNMYGEKLIEFVKDMKLCIINGRVSPENGNFTCVSTRGRSVVDYFLTEQCSLNTCAEFKVFNTLDLLNLFFLQDLVSTVCKPPDHSVIWLKVNISSYGVKETESILSENTQSNDVRIHNVDSTVPSSRYFERYNLHKNSDRCMNNESWRLALNDVINHINNAKRCQNDIDDLYDLLCRNIYQELDKFYKKIDVRKPTRKRYRKTKPYWDSELNELWQSMCFAEKIFVKFKGSSLTKKQLQREFVAARNIFDKKERAYRREKINEIDSLNSKNPKEFWNRVNNLLPGQRKKIPDRVKRGEDFVTDRLDVLDTWGEDLKKNCIIEPMVMLKKLV